ncbi:hypothetical protein INF35_00210 [Subdoligranulum sp. DSM 109015]|uniref:Uncharacterized protein n=1 Tax=Gemmiger gallinarum TaxID=2779354 RepID=A0ABR9QZC4_9FIRM|nr:hypothetical protein [Gemmiger gallinarum]MBE5036230.1 hypothetical protein [Gemmiger gallinarum]
MYTVGDSMLEVRELLIKAFASAWRAGEQATDRDTYITSSINVITSIQIQPEMIYAEEGQGLVDGEQLDHIEDLVRADGAWVYYGVPAENFFLVTWMPDAETARQKVEALQAEGDCIACVVDLGEQWQFGE